MISTPPFAFLRFKNLPSSTDYFVHQFKRADTVYMQVFADVSATGIRVDIVNNDLTVIAQNVGTAILLGTGVWGLSVTIPLALIKNNCYRFFVREAKSGFCQTPAICTIVDFCAVGGQVFENGVYSNPFRIIYDVEEKYTQIIRYANSEGFAGFLYSQSFFNQLRLPIQLLRPQTKDEIETYRNSRGEYAMISANSELEYELETQIADEAFHLSMRNALLHDFIIMNGVRHFNLESYQVSWSKAKNNSQMAKGSTRVRLSPYNINNPNFSSNEFEWSGFSIGFSTGFNG